MERKLTVAEIESIVFNPIGMGQFPYKLKKVEVNHPNQNVAGYMRIGDDYYKYEYDMSVQHFPRSSERRRSSMFSMDRFSIDRLFGY